MYKIKFTDKEKQNYLKNISQEMKRKRAYNSKKSIKEYSE